MPRGPSLKRQRQDAMGTAGSAGSGAQGSGALPTWHGGETVRDQVMDDEASDQHLEVAGGATAPAGVPDLGNGSQCPAALLPPADDVQPAPFALVEWADVPLCVRAECRGLCAGAGVGLVLPNAGVARAYVRWFFQSNSDARITCLIDHNYEHIYGLRAAVDCFRALNQEGRPTLWFKQLWGCSDPSCVCQPRGTRVPHTR